MTSPQKCPCGGVVGETCTHDKNSQLPDYSGNPWVPPLPGSFVNPRGVSEPEFFLRMPGGGTVYVKPQDVAPSMVDLVCDLGSWSEE